MDGSPRVVIVGAGIVGLATGYALLSRRPGLRVRIVEKETQVGRHQSTHNSGVLHAGLYYAPGSLKARLAVSGLQRMVAFCRDHAIPHEICGKLVVAVDEEQRLRLASLLERGRRNGLRGLRWLTSDEAREIEPHVRCVAAVHVPEEGITDFGAVCLTLADRLRARGAEFSLGHAVTRARRRGPRWEVVTPAAVHEADVLVNCAGLHADTVAALAGVRPPCRIVPFRGEYFRLRQDRESLVRNLIYPVPDPTFPFLGVHFTRQIGGGIEAGPNAVLALAREGYTRTTLHPRELREALLYPGLWRFLRRHPRASWTELRRSLSRRLFCASLQRLVPEVVEADLVPGGAGVRAQAMRPTGELVEDFLLLTRPGAIHVLNAPSPAATASLAIGEEIAAGIEGMLAA
ncbi:MAG: L-2-hydroxyglutarate oxidase [Gemmatimonadales bacterium]|nr:L-2-hydroxyglutarate oxidase [Gemmatimonadales bacterium]